MQGSAAGYRSSCALGAWKLLPLQGPPAVCARELGCWCRCKVLCVSRSVCCVRLKAWCWWRWLCGLGAWVPERRCCGLGVAGRRCCARLGGWVLLGRWRCCRAPLTCRCSVPWQCAAGAAASLFAICGLRLRNFECKWVQQTKTSRITPA